MTTSPPLQDFLDADNGVYSNSPPASSVTHPDGNPNLTLVMTSPTSELASGFFAQAFEDTTTNTIIIAYEGSLLDESNPLYNSAYGQASRNVDFTDILTGLPQTSLLTIESDALTFAQQVEKQPNLSSDPLYISGHSMGGVEAEYVGLEASLGAINIAGGVTFGAPGLPDNPSLAGYGPAGSTPFPFVDYVDNGDLVGNWATDTSSLVQGLGSIYLPFQNFYHFGTVDPVGSSSSFGAELLKDAASFSIDYLLEGPAAILQTASILETNGAPYHGLTEYASDLNHSLTTPSVSNTSSISDISSALPFIQKEVSAIQPTPAVTAYPVVTAAPTQSAPANSPVNLKSLFSASETPAGSGHSISHYTIIFSNGPGQINVNGNIYTAGNVVANVSTQAFNAAYLNTGATSGVDDITVYAFDDANTPSLPAETTISVTAPAISDASVTAGLNTQVSLQPYFSLLNPISDKTISLVNFINTKTGPGQLTSSGSVLTANTAVSYSSIGQVGFLTGSSSGSDLIEIYATYSDGTTSNTVDLTVNAVASPHSTPPPQNSSGPVVNTNVQTFNVTIGQQGVLSSANLSASDAAYADPSELTYNITKGSLDGVILDSGQVASSFTQADINAGRVVYQSGYVPGLTSPETDTFSYVVSDPSFRESAVSTASIQIEPLPPPQQTQQPYIDTNYFPTVPEGGQIFVLGNRFSTQDLHVTDSNPNFPSYYTGSSKDSSIIYTVVQGPSHGELEWFTNNPTLWLPGQPSYFGQQVTQFTQNDLNNGWFVYINNFTSGASDSFTFTVSDGFGGTIGLTTATIPIQPVDPVILRINAGVFVTAGGQSIISPDWLQVSDAAPNAYPNDQPIFDIVQGPSHGTLLVSGQVASTFTQLDVDRGLVTYQQNGSSAQSDQFTLAVANDAYGNTISDLVVPVTIASTALDRNTGAFVSLGQSVAIGAANLHVSAPGMGSGNIYADTPANLLYTLTALPAHGALSVNGSTLQLGGQFTQDQLDNNLLIYTEDGSIAASDSFGFSISDASVHNNFGSGTFDIGISGTKGGLVFIGGPTASVFNSGPGNNWITGGNDTTISYADAPAGITLNLVTGTASNGFGGTDTISNVHSVIGSPFNDLIVGDHTDTVIYSGNRSDYAMSYNATTQSFTVSDQRSGSPDGTDTVTNIEQFQFADGVSTYDAQGNLSAQTIDNVNGSYRVNTYDPENTSNLLWSTSSYDANGNLLSQTTTNNDGTHSLTMYDVNNSYNWSSVTINFDAQWNQTSVSGTNDDGSHTTTPKGLASAYDTALWFATPFDPNWNSTAPVTLTGGSANDVLVGNAGNDMLVAGTGNDIFYGNGGSNTFAFGPGSGQDKIMDFQTDQDTIQFNPALFANYAAVLQDTTQVGANTVIQHDANSSVTLENVAANSLTANNFHFS
jgi:hypothetical protein